MKRILRLLIVVLVLAISMSVTPLSPAKAATDYVSASTSVNPSNILVGGETEVTLNIQGTPPINVVKPNDVILVIDKSGSMSGEKMTSAKNAAKGFIDLMDFTQHRIGIVDYSGDTSIDSFDLTSDAQSAKNYVDTINSNGGTSTGKAIEKATELLSNHRSEAQPVIVLLTDGEATGTGDGLNAFDYTLKKAEEAKNAGIVFYTIALLNANDNPDTSAPNILMKNMATTSHHHHFILGSVGLAEIYAAIVQEIGLASAYDVLVNVNVNNGFEIVPGSYDNNIPKPTVNGNTLSWSFLELKRDALSFTYKIRQKQGGVNGTFPVTTSTSNITYKDYTGANKTYKIPSADVVVSYPAPIINSVTPPKGSISGGEEVTILGQNFLPNPKVKFGGAFSSNVTYVSDSELKAITPPGTQGKVALSVINTDKQTATADFAYYAQPEITSLTPASGPMNGGTKLVISGKNFLPDVKVKVGENYSPTVTYNSSGYLFAITPAATEPGTVDVKIENPDGTEVTRPAAFTYEAPPTVELISITPTEGETTGGTKVTLTGKEFKSTSKVYFNDVEAASVSFYSKTQLTAITPTWLQPETVDVKVVNEDGTESVITQAYSFIAPPPPGPPTVTAVSPANGPLAGGTTVYIDGKDFVSGATIIVGDTEEVLSKFVNSTRLTFKTPAWTTPETVNITVVNPDEQFFTIQGAFTYDAPPELPAPTVKGISPANGPLIGGTTIYLDGTGFNAETKLLFVIDGNEVDLGASFVTSTRLKAKTPTGTNPGPVDVKVLNADGKANVLPGGFNYDAPPVYPDPVITSIDPNQANKRGGTLINIFGTDFQQGAIVTIGSQQVPLAAFMSSSNVRIKVPAVEIAGPVDVTITNPDGKSSTLVGGFTYQEDMPTVKAISPSTGPMAGGTIVYVDGTYFTPDLTVTMNNVQVNYTYVNSTRIKLTTPASAVPGPVEIKITNPAGLSATTTFTYEVPPAVPAPILTGASPTSGTAKGGTTIYIDGKNFKSGATIVFDGIEYATTYVNTTRLKFKTPAGTVGVVSYYIINPDGQQTDTSLNFEYM